MIVAMAMFRDSGALLLLQLVLDPVLNVIAFPSELLPMAIMRPLSGGGSIGIAGEIVSVHGADSTIGLTAATMLGSTETTFYVLAVYFGSVGVRRVRHAAAAGLIADLVGIVSAVTICRLVFG